MKISELIVALEKVKAEAGDIEIYRQDEELGGRHSINMISKVTVKKRVHIAGTVWPNEQWEYVDDYSYWQIE